MRFPYKARSFAWCMRFLYAGRVGESRRLLSAPVRDDLLPPPRGGLLARECAPRHALRLCCLMLLLPAGPVRAGAWCRWNCLVRRRGLASGGLRQGRRQRGLTREQLAKLIRCSVSTIQRAESGDRPPSLSMCPTSPVRVLDEFLRVRRLLVN
ncbi:multiprotein-bridging factor 1 family protein [Streptomyces sp. NPDC056361]|uniref:helix-turn-helix domain-containing protein n=1 Tax=Streptomyces sp. NPDC056361 TaxID=3345795 RepID=UPI0035E2254D